MPFAGADETPPGHGAATESLRTWAESFLTRPNPDLGRDGSVCPYVRPALDRGLMWVCCISGHRPDIRQLRETMYDALDIYPTLTQGHASAKSVLCAMVTLFPQVTDYRMVDDLHEEFKSSFVDQGTMLGQFYPGCAQSGLWNKEFRPLNSPVPMLVVRSMMSTDFPFLLERPEWMNAYVRKFAPQLPAHVRAAVVGRLTAQPEHEVPAYIAQPEPAGAPVPGGRS
ncbi:hypothetical protein EBN03_13580 [Nocardia stercoris]|uniref:DUF6875 domain-containing protein n=1 Tax=Nocardia stercoris TaxID=2483361 RepID=A0A3M2L5W0_9NOCA|nr:hypothetical protein [Nocardia stercoris]RMI33039.1 hypothetical protein EBN03_13580 [Nocardia stercoris]